MKNKNGYCTAILIGIVASLFTIISVVTAVMIMLDRKKKREDKELEDYLETSIN